MKLKFIFNYSSCVFQYVRDSNIYIGFFFFFNKPISLFSKETILCLYTAVHEMLHFQDRFAYSRKSLSCKDFQEFYS